MNKVTIEILKSGSAQVPKYMTEGAAGADMYASLDNDVIIHPMERMLVPTGIKMAIPEGYEVQLRPRSGLALKHGLTLLNTPGTIDSDYRGEFKVLIINLSNESFKISNGERIAQMVVNKIEQASFNEVSDLSESTRGKGGFGHTGL